MNRPAADPGLEQELRAVFAEATADLPPTRDPWARTTRAVVRSRARRRAGALASVAAAAAVAVLAVVHPVARHTPPPAGPVVTDPDVRSWPTRGDLAGRADVRAAVVARVQSGAGPKVLSVPFLGTVDDLSAAMVVAAPDEGPGASAAPQVILLYGRKGAPVVDWFVQSGSVGPTAQQVLSAIFTDGRERTHGIAVTLTDGVRLAWSPRPFVDAEGRPVRRYVPLPLTDGVGTWSTRWRAGPLTLRVETSFLRGVVQPSVQGVEDERPPSAPAAEPSRGCADQQYAAMADSAVPDALRLTGVRSTEVTGVRMLWCGRVGGESAVLTGVTTGGGADIQLLSEKVGDATSEVRHQRLRLVPPGRGMDYPWALELSADHDRPGTAPGRDVVTVIAPGNVTAELQQGDPPAVFAQRKLTADGFARVELSASETSRWRDRQAPRVLVTRDVHGIVLHRAPVPALDANPFSAELDGPDAATDAPPGGQ